MSDMSEHCADQAHDQSATSSGGNRVSRYQILAILLLIVAATIGIWAMRSSGSPWALVPLLACMVYAVALFLVRKAWQEKADEQKQRSLRLLGLCALIAALLSSAFILIFSEAKHIDNTLDGMNLFRLYFFLGAGIGAMLGARLARMLSVKKIFVIKAFLISFALFAITGASQINREGGDGEESLFQAAVLKKDSHKAGLMSLLSAGEPARFVYILYEESEQRLILPKLLWNTIIPRDSADLTVREGYLGYPYVMKLNGHPLQ